MDLNRETAMRLWNKSFGKDTKAADFAGRIIAKGAYNDRNSEFGWNVDHVLPQSRGALRQTIIWFAATLVRTMKRQINFRALLQTELLLKS